MFKSLLAGIFLHLSSALFAQVSGTPEIALQQTEAYGEKVLFVSFNGDDEPFGSFTVTNSEGKVVYAIREAELIPSPNYFTVNLEEFEADEYNFVIRTAKGTYTTRFTIHN